jgi:hypothetical protein
MLSSICNTFCFPSYISDMRHSLSAFLKKGLFGSMVELTCHILENATSVESLTVDTIFNEVADSNISRCSVYSTGKCSPVGRDKILEARKSLSVMRSHILGRVPSAVKLNVGEPCNRCHVIDV